MDEKEMTTLLYNDDVICIKDQHYGTSKRCRCKIKTQTAFACSLVAVFLFVFTVYLIHSYVNQTRQQSGDVFDNDIDPLSYSPCGNLTTRLRCPSGSNCVSRIRRLIGGTESNVSWPWMVEIVYNNQHYCGAVLISQNFILTAAHCLFHDGHRIYSDSLQVKIGSRYKLASDKQTQTLKISTIFIHSSFKLATLENDIAAIKLEKNVIYTNTISPVCLSAVVEFSHETNAVMTGWGKTQYEGEFSSNLKEANVPIVPVSKCKEANKGLFEGVYVDEENNICVGYGKSRPEYGCNGDSGGPLMVETKDKRWALIGIMSWGGPECSSTTTDSYTVFTKIYKYRTWIESILKYQMLA